MNKKARAPGGDQTWCLSIAGQEVQKNDWLSMLDNMFWGLKLMSIMFEASLVEIRKWTMFPKEYYSIFIRFLAWGQSQHIIWQIIKIFNSILYSIK